MFKGPTSIFWRACITRQNIFELSLLPIVNILDKHPSEAKTIIIAILASTSAAEIELSLITADLLSRMQCAINKPHSFATKNLMLKAIFATNGPVEFPKLDLTWRSLSWSFDDAFEYSGKGREVEPRSPNLNIKRGVDNCVAPGSIFQGRGFGLVFERIERMILTVIWKVRS